MERNLLERYIEGNVTDEEVKIIIAWMKEDESHLAEVRALRKLYAISLFNNPDVRESGEKPAAINRGFHYRRVIREFLKIAAVFLIAFIGFHWLHKEPEPKPQYQTLFAPAGQRAELTLADGTKIWLNSLSKITYPTDFNKKSRNVELEGEAYFDVSHDSERPFTVKTQHLNIKVLGTEFNVIDYSNSSNTEVALLKGNIELLPVGASTIYQMKENERVRIQNNQLISEKNQQETQTKENLPEEKNLKKAIIHSYPITNYDYFEWKNGLICFEDEPVDWILNKLEVCYDMKIIYQDASFTKKKYTGKFRLKDDIERVLKVLQLKENFKFERDEDKNIITIK